MLAKRTLLEGGPSTNRLDFYFLAEGYPIEDDYQAAFLVSANAAMQLLLKDEPYKEYQSYLNFYAVQLGSKERGVDRYPGDVDRDTALGGRIEWDRFTVDNQKVMEVLRELGEGGNDGQALVIGNDYAGVATGGGGVSSLSKVSLDAIGHEIGHSLTGLYDEYEYEPGTDPQRPVDRQRPENVPTRQLPPNLMRGSNRDEVLSQVLWQHWIDAGEEAWWNGQGVSVFEGGNRTRFNHWRPQATCKMRTSASRFCVVCMEAMVKRFYEFVRPIDRTEPEGSEIALDKAESADVRVWVMKPETHFLEATWKLERLPSEPSGPTAVVTPAQEVSLKSVYRRFDAAGRVVETAVIRGRELEAGRYQLKLTVRDPTPWVLRDEDGLLSETHSWTIVVKP